MGVCWCETTQITGKKFEIIVFGSYSVAAGSTIWACMSLSKDSKDEKNEP
jgi:hypothetical protein